MSALKSIFLCRCPKCHDGKIFLDQNPYHLSNISKMEKQCPVCGFDLENETGFHFLSMYMSYIVSMGFSFLFLMLPTSPALHLNDWPPIANFSICQFQQKLLPNANTKQPSSEVQLVL